MYVIDDMHMTGDTRSVTVIDDSQHPRQNVKAVEKMVKSIQRNGFFGTIVIDTENKLVAHWIAFQALKRLGYTTIPVTIIDPKDPLKIFLDENLVRHPLLPTEIAAIAKLEMNRLKPEAKDRQRTAKARAASGQFPDIESGEALEILANKVGKSRKTLEKLIAVMEAAKNIPECADLPAEMDRQNSIDGAYNRMLYIKNKILKESMDIPLPKGKFDVIVSDPAWDYPGQRNLKNLTLICPYYCDDITEIADLDLPSLAAKDCILFLWATTFSQSLGYDLIENWGFNFKRTITWIKSRPVMSRGGKMPSHQTEFVMVATKGNPMFDLTDFVDIIDSRAKKNANADVPEVKEIRRHSKKPQAFFDMIEKGCPGSKVELYGRDPRPGWVVWGLEAPTDQDDGAVPDSCQTEENEIIPEEREEETSVIPSQSTPLKPKSALRKRA